MIDHPKVAAGKFASLLSRRQVLRALALATSLLGCGVRSTAAVESATVSVAAAANLVHALDAVNAEFKRLNPEVELKVSLGASGSLFAQIKHGAPYDVFLSADTIYAEQLVAEKLADAATLRVFATGQLVLWTTREHLDLTDFAAAMRDPAVKKLAIAQPKTAPYGRAAIATLHHLGVWAEARPKLVLGESIAQAAQFIDSGNAELGFVARSIVVSPRLAGKGHWVVIPPEMHRGAVLDHAAVITARGSTNSAAHRYLEFLGGESAKKILRDFGYSVR